VAIALSRSERLESGAVLSLGAERAVVVRLETPRWLGLRPRDTAAALEVGYAVGNMHWRVRFEAGGIWVRLDGDASVYRARIADLLDSGRAAVVEPKAADEAPRHGHSHGHGADASAPLLQRAQPEEKGA
jgi:urease accessory protein